MHFRKRLEFVMRNCKTPAVCFSDMQLDISKYVIYVKSDTMTRSVWSFGSTLLLKASGSITGSESFDVRSIPKEDKEKSLIGFPASGCSTCSCKREYRYGQDLLNFCFTYNFKSEINPLNTKHRLLYLKTQFVPRCKHFPTWL